MRGAVGFHPVGEKLKKGYRADAGYHAVVAANGITPLYCWAHARRYFIEALKALGLNPNKLPLKAPDKARRPLKALDFIRQLYAIEQRVREQTPTERLAVRQTESVPVLNALHAWLLATSPKVMPAHAGKELQALRGEEPPDVGLPHSFAMPLRDQRIVTFKYTVFKCQYSHSSFYGVTFAIRN